MSPFICYHATGPGYRESIRRRGLRARCPRMEIGISGVYAFSPDLHNPDSHPVEWYAGPGRDVWQIAWIGPMRPDPLVRNGIILPSVTDVTLVTGNE